MTQSISAPPRRPSKLDLKVPALLLALSAVPMVGGIMRLRSFSEGAVISAENARFVASPGPILLHIFTAALFCLLGAFQFSAGVRRRWPRWHRQAGKLLALCGVLAGMSGIWMTMAYPIPVAMQGPLLYAVRVVVGTGMVASIVISWRRILQRDVASHEAWMIRAYALGQGAGTQVVVLLPWMLISGESGGLTRDLLMTLAWVINLVVAESIIRWRAQGGAPRAHRDGLVPQTGVLRSLR